MGTRITVWKANSREEESYLKVVEPIEHLAQLLEAIHA